MDRISIEEFMPDTLDDQGCLFVSLEGHLYAAHLGSEASLAAIRNEWLAFLHHKRIINPLTRLDESLDVEFMFHPAGCSHIEALYHDPANSDAAEMVMERSNTFLAEYMDGIGRRFAGIKSLN